MMKLLTSKIERSDGRAFKSRRARYFFSDDNNEKVVNGKRLDEISNYQIENLITKSYHKILKQ